MGSTVVVLGGGSLVRYGYKFLGWDPAVTAVSPSYLEGVSFIITLDVVLFAMWQALPRYTVSYMPNGATDGLSPVDPDDYLAGETVTVQNNTGGLVRDGYKLLGWAFGSAAVVPDFVIIQGEVVPSVFNMSEGNVVLYAVWQKVNMYTVTYDGNGADGGSVPQNSNIYALDSVVSVRGNINHLVREGYDFLGWATTQNAATPDYIVDESNHVTPSTFIISSTVILYAVWLIKPVFTVTYHANYPFGLTGSGSVPLDSNTYYNEAAVGVQGNLGSLRVDGYVFVGWLYGSTLITVYDNIAYPPTVTIVGADIDLYAVWQLIKPTDKPPFLSEPWFGTTKSLAEIGSSGASYVYRKDEKTDPKEIES